MVFGSFSSSKNRLQTADVTYRLQAMGDDTPCGSHLPLMLTRCLVQSILEVVDACSRNYSIVEFIPLVDDAVAEEVVPLVAVSHQFPSHLSPFFTSWGGQLT